MAASVPPPFSRSASRWLRVILKTWPSKASKIHPIEAIAKISHWYRVTPAYQAAFGRAGLASTGGTERVGGAVIWDQKRLRTPSWRTSFGFVAWALLVTETSTDDHNKIGFAAGFGATELARTRLRASVQSRDHPSSALSSILRISSPTSHPVAWR